MVDIEIIGPGDGMFVNIDKVVGSIDDVIDDGVFDGKVVGAAYGA